MLIANLGLAPATRRAVQAAGITSVEQLRRSANELLEQITGAELYDVVCCLQAHELGLLTDRRSSLASESDLEMLRLRVVDGLALREIAVICDRSCERVRQRLNQRFGLSGEPPAAMARRSRHAAAFRGDRARVRS